MKVYTMTILVIQLFAVLLIVEGTLGAKGRNCGPDEEWTNCGTACVNSCDNRHTYSACIALCVPGCYCRENYIRRTNKGPCIPIQDCPPA